MHFSLVVPLLLCVNTNALILKLASTPFRVGVLVEFYVKIMCLIVDFSRNKKCLKIVFSLFFTRTTFSIVIAVQWHNFAHIVFALCNSINNCDILLYGWHYTLFSHLYMMVEIKIRYSKAGINEARDCQK